MKPLSSLPDILSPIRDLKLKPARAGLPRERRDIAARTALVNRVRGEFSEMPGLSITLAQATRLFGLRKDVCDRVLNQLVRDGLLDIAPGASYKGRSQT